MNDISNRATYDYPLEDMTTRLKKGTPLHKILSVYICIRLFMIKQNLQKENFSSICNLLKNDRMFFCLGMKN
jgi:hypothetical protein